MSVLKQPELKILTKRACKVYNVCKATYVKTNLMKNNFRYQLIDNRRKDLMAITKHNPNKKQRVQNKKMFILIINKNCKMFY